MPKYSNIVMTGGISAFNSSNVFYQYFAEFIENKSSYAGQNLEKVLEEICKEKGLTDKEIERLVKERPNQISAEFSMLKGLKEKDLLDDIINISVIHSDTPDGIMAALINKKVIELVFKDSTVSLVKVGDVDISNEVKLQRSLGYFMQIVADKLFNGSKETTFFAPIGGYKYMAYLGYVAGALFGYSSGYMYEKGQKLLTIPPIPIEINFDLITKNKNFIRNLLTEGQLNYQSLSPDEKEIVDTMPYFFEKVEIDGQEIVSANAFAEFIFGDYISTAVKVSPEVSDLISKNEQYRNFILNQLMGLIKKANSFFKDYRNYQGLRGELMHNENWGIDRPYLYKGSSNGNKLVFRCAYDFDYKSRILYIYKIWLNHDKYEREAEAIKNGKITIDMDKNKMFELEY
ncbi:CRISPR-associated protein, APE2256 family [Caldicellulosiruptor acetigenus I77R1B]|uniref:CRISPR-associated protein, APE2256 family n=1 Tax=Caldicellulosiruptor acetigenus (strain ATCC 700853 / DSM 12137 / I77R1B) TaxID=632335 RepID=E4S910_CALA7|nr:putative CRISPR-associated protein [Caldicellulosiruptor acetigenus]ADQ42015.1 CRISPR-associated protein, APE2256 family [Caldicellulosiruptor acetigenus I77R1B]